jgi:6-phosphogluconolactonase
MMNQPIKIEVFNDYHEIADFIRSIISSDATSESFNIALSGGNTPRAIYSLLSEYKQPQIPWERMKFFWGDERCVPPDNPESNYLMTKESLFDKINIADDQVFRIKGENNPEVERERYSKIVLSNTNGAFDLMLLGLGTDGHTASIFKNQLGLMNSEQLCAIAVHPESGQVRITLTGRLINASRKILFLVTGSDKSQVLYNILYQKGEWDKYPASYVRPSDGEIIWILDRKAAARI